MGIGFGLYKVGFVSLWRDLKKLDFLIVPTFIGLFPVLSLYARNIGEVPGHLAFEPIFIVILVSVLGTLLFFYLIRDRAKASIITSLSWIFFFTYIPLVTAGYTSWPNLENLDSYLIPFWFLMLTAVSVMIFKSNRNFKPFYQLLLIAGVVVIAIQLFSIASHELNPAFKKSSINRSDYFVNHEDEKLNPSDDYPNIYYILLDSYPRSDTLKDYFQFDNGEFDNYLVTKGFGVLNNTYSNYNHTALSVPATLNMSYFKDTKELKEPLLVELFKSNFVYDYLRSGGYEIINNTTFYATKFNEYVDYNIKCASNNELLTELINITPLKTLDILTDTQRANKRDDALCTFANIQGDVGVKDPRLVSTHLLPPHPPYLFDSEGADTTEVNLGLDGWTRWLAKKPYVEQLQYVNKRIQEQVSQILNNDKDSIIIIQSDHGTLSSATEAHNLSDTRDIVLKERSRSYTAIYLPDHCDKSVPYKSMHNVNTFRVIFNSCFNSNFDILEDLVFYAKPKIHSAPFEDITNKVQN